MKFKLIPRFHYTFRLIDIFLSLVVFRNRKIAALDYFRTKELYHLNSARSGLFLLLKSIAKGRPLNVAVQPYSCETVFLSIAKAGCIPVFLDIDCNFSFNKKTIIEKAHSFDIIIITHTFGISLLDFTELKTILKDKIIIEDCAHAFLSENRDKPCGTFGDAAVFSLGYGKFPSIGHGGFVLINEPKIRRDFELHYNQLKQPNFFAEGKEVITNYLYSIALNPFIYGLITFPIFKRLDKKYDFIQKKSFKVIKGYRVNQNVFYNNFNRFIKINDLRREKSLRFVLMLSKKPEYLGVHGSNNYLIPLLRPNRDIICALLMKKRFECGKHFSKSINRALNYGYVLGSCPNSEKIAREIMVIPSVAHMNEREFRSIVEIIDNAIL